jgi:DNA-binding CsgD family transcriptional regulator
MSRGPPPWSLSPTRRTRRSCPTPSLGHMYGLTHAEGQLATLLLQGLSVKDAAVHLHRNLHTTRTQLKQIFQKTGTRRQAEFIKLLLSHPALLAREAPRSKRP